MNMKNIWIFGGIVAVVIIVSYIFLRDGEWEVKNVPPKNNTVVVFGDSLVEGIGSTDGSDLVSILDGDMQQTFINHGVSGDTTRDALERVDDVLEESAGMVIIVLGGNDVLQDLPKDETFKNLEEMITLFQSNGSAVVLVGVRSGVVGNGRDEDYRNLAEATGALYISDILQDVFGKREYMSDSIHPNDAGYKIIAQRLVGEIESLF